MHDAPSPWIARWQFGRRVEQAASAETALVAECRMIGVGVEDGQNALAQLLARPPPP